VVWVGVVVIVWCVLDVAGVWNSVNIRVADALGPAFVGFDVSAYRGIRRVVWSACFVGVVNVAVVTTSAALASLVHDLAALLFGGIEVRVVRQG